MNNIALVIYMAATSYQVDPTVLYSLCNVESNLNPAAVNKHDGGPGQHSLGLCQVKYTTARLMGMPADRNCVNSHKLRRCSLMQPEINATYAAAYLRYQLDRYRGNIRKAISAYNAGTYTRRNSKYVRKVLSPSRTVVPRSGVGTK